MANLNWGTMSKYSREKGNKNNFRDPKKLGTNLKVIWGTRKHKQVLKGNQGTMNPLGGPHLTDCKQWTFQAK